MSTSTAEAGPRARKREAIDEALRAEPGLSDREHARQLEVDHKTIASRRAALLDAGEIPQRSNDAGEVPQPTPEPAAESAPAAGPKRYRVLAPFINVKTMTLAAAGMPGRGGYTVIGLYQHALLPQDAPAEDVERLLRRGMVEEVA